MQQIQSVNFNGFLGFSFLDAASSCFWQCFVCVGRLILVLVVARDLPPDLLGLSFLKENNNDLTFILAAVTTCYNTYLSRRFVLGSRTFTLVGTPV